MLVAALRPQSYLGIDLMPEMIELAKKRCDRPNCQFRVMDASDMTAIADESKDTVVVFGILHHVPKWRQAIRECYRVLRPGGRVFLEEPDARVVRLWDAVFQWGHPSDAAFRIIELEEHLAAVGFRIVRRLSALPFGAYCAEKRNG